MSTRARARRAVVVGALTVALLVGGPAPGYAHEGLGLTIRHDGHGSIWATVTWEDGHPVSEPVAATISAREFGGRTVDAEPMRASGDAAQPGTLLYAGTLDTGQWTVNIDVNEPGRGSCAAVLVVGPTGEAESIACADPPGGAGPAAAASATSNDDPTLTLVVVGLAGMAGIGAVLALRRRRVSPSPDDAGR